MDNDRSDIFPKLEFAHHYQLNSSSETVVSQEREHSHSSTSTIAPIHISEKGIMVALGFITTLLFFSGMQLYRCVHPAKVKTTKSQRVFTLNTKNLTTETFAKKLDRQQNYKVTEIWGIQNEVSYGKF